jgi:alpha-galactosidase
MSNDLAVTPPMGWNSWNGIGAKVSEQIVVEIAETLVSTGLKDLGYRYVVIDDCWSMNARNPHGDLVPDRERFPGGIRALAGRVHSLGLKLGIYSDAAEKTCGGYLGSLGFEDQDAAQWAGWGIDLLKYDYCHAPLDQATAIARYRRMGEALRSTGRAILYSICEWGGRAPALWARDVGGHMWRVAADVLDSWTDVYVARANWTGAGIDTAIDAAAALHPFGGPGGWNDLDMLVVGLKGRGTIPGEGATFLEYRTQMSMWCLLCSPLMIGCDIRTMDEKTKELLTNPEVIALNQDSLGRPGVRIRSDGELEVWKKQLAGGSIAVALRNRLSRAADFTVQAGELGLLDDFKGRVRDLWKREEQEFSTPLQVRVQPHDTVLLRIGG